MKKRPAYKTAHRLGAPIFEKTQTQKYAAWEQKKPFKRRRGPRTDYAKQMKEKQKAKFTYGISEKQFRRYAEAAMQKDKPGAELFRGLETRLDNVIYRSGLAPTRRAARQMVSHGHITINERKIDVPSYAVKAVDTFSVRPGSLQKKHLLDVEPAQTAPSWIDFSFEKKTGQLKNSPAVQDHELLFDLDAIIEFYNR